MRWQYLLAVGPFDQGGEVELATLRMHHAGGKIEFYRPDFESRLACSPVLAIFSGWWTNLAYLSQIVAELVRRCARVVVIGSRPGWCTVGVVSDGQVFFLLL